MTEPTKLKIDCRWLVTCTIGTKRVEIRHNDCGHGASDVPVIMEWDARSLAQPTVALACSPLSA